MLIKYDENYDSVDIIMGGNTNNPTWNEYIDGFKLKARPYLRGLRQLIEESGLIGKTGQETEAMYFQSEDGNFKIAYTWRAWGDLMQAIVGKREGYMKYYM